MSSRSNTIAVYRRHEPTITFFADVLPVLKRLRIGYKLGVITDGPAQQQRNKIEALGLTEMAYDLLVDSRFGSNKQHRLVPLLSLENPRLRRGTGSI